MPQQVTRLGIVFAFVIAALVGARSVLVPKTFGAIGHYRAAAVTTIAARAPKYVGRAECVDCHTEVQKKAAVDHHRGLSCEVCHGPQPKHAEDPDSAPNPIPKDKILCPRCHSYDASRPTGFPQVDLQAHHVLTPCVKCHEPHAPAAKTPPAECSACHGQIARQKVASHHADLPCTTCHTVVPPLHLSAPSQALPSKPSERAFCGRCHAPDAKRPAFISTTREIPKVDIEKHGGRDLCWQCHYPHFPEK